MDSKILAQKKDCRSNSHQDLKQKIIAYYDECFIDYRLFWLDSKNLAMHYGYWDENTTSHSQSLLDMNRALSQAISIKPGAKILDAGCGVGGSSIWLARNFDVQVTGITLAASQVGRAQQYAKQKEVSGRVNFQTGDYCNTDFADQSFDIVWGLESICYAVDKRDFVAEAYRLLRPGGQLVVADGFANKTEFSVEEWRYVKDFLDGCVVPNFATVAEFKNAMQSCNFQGINYRDITKQVLPSSKVLYRKSQLTYPIEKILGWLRIRTPSQTANYYAAKSQYQIFQQGMAGYGIFSGRK